MKNFTLSSISWIDRNGIPNIGLGFVASAGMKWHKRVIMGLLATSNPPPAKTIENIETFRQRKQYRAITHYKHSEFHNFDSYTIVDAGYTPAFNKSGLNTQIMTYIPDMLLKDSLNDPKPYPGDKSPLSAIVKDKLHSCSTLTIPNGSDVIISSLIKFRAGEHTDETGINDAISPTHVPWVWCECALIRNGGTYSLITNGSIFPSHAWYLNGQQVGMSLQAPISDSEKEPVISTGRQAAQPWQSSDKDQSMGRVDKHLYAIESGKQTEIDLSRFFR